MAYWRMTPPEDNMTAPTFTEEEYIFPLLYMSHERYMYSLMVNKHQFYFSGFKDFFSFKFEKAVFQITIFQTNRN